MTKIALVDDGSSIRKAVGRLLRSNGYQCTVYESAEAALADPALREMSCLLIDVELPGISGFDLQDRLRGLGSTVPHIFVTAHSETDCPDWGARLGDSPYLTKPVEELLLLSTIEKVLFLVEIHCAGPHHGTFVA